MKKNKKKKKTPSIIFLFFIFEKKTPSIIGAKDTDVQSTLNTLSFFETVDIKHIKKIL